MIQTIACDISDLDSAVEAVLETAELQSMFFSGRKPSTLLSDLLGSLRPELNAVVEYPYVDKVYRDSYYSYFASKATNYPRNCIRVALFEPGLEGGMFYNEEGRKWLKENFHGFFVIRPTMLSILGRNCISPRAFRVPDIRTCLTSIDASIHNVKMSCLGFPHSSQDAETITCAETSLWALLEYFSNRYAEYHPVLPTKIHSILAGMSVERQVPSRGLEVARLSYALKAFGFAPRIYHAEDFEDDEFKDLLDVYIESGLPVITCMSNGKVHHAFLTVGKRDNDVVGKVSRLGERDGFGIFDFPNAKNLVVIDDNCPPYTILDSDAPSKHYAGVPSWSHCQIFAMIVPLHQKTYMEAYEARGYVTAQLEQSILFKDLAAPLSTKVYLASGRSYKDYVIACDEMDDDTRQMILGMELPKFIWVAELYNCTDTGAVIPQPGSPSGPFAQGLLIVDATEPYSASPLGLILGTWGDLLLYREGGGMAEINVTSRPFTGFNNLTSTI